LRTLHSLQIHGVALSFYDEDTSLTALQVTRELLNDIYGFEAIGFQPRDIVIDIGAHVGLVSMYLAKRWPSLRIYAFEPHPGNHANCSENLRRNHVTNVCLFPQGVTSDGRPITLQLLRYNTGGATAVFDLPGADTVGPLLSVTLQDIFERTLASGERCRLLKVDCEGMEYEILPSPVLNRVDFFAAEFHEGVFGDGECRGVKLGAADALRDACTGFLSPERMRIVYCRKEN